MQTASSRIWTRVDNFIFKMITDMPQVKFNGLSTYGLINVKIQFIPKRFISIKTIYF